MPDTFNTEGMLDIYLYENGQLLEQLEEIVLRYKDEKSFDDSSINEIFRIMHTIKGSSGVMMYDNIMTVSHKLEDVFYYLRESHPDNVPHLELTECVLAVADFINAEMDKIRNGSEPDGDATALIKKTEAFLNKIKKNIKKSGEELPPENVSTPPSQYYIAPVASDSSHFYKIKVSYHPDTVMCNIRAYAAVYALKEIAEDLLYVPEDIVTNEDSAKTILEDGFKIMLQSQCDVNKIKELVDTSSEISALDIEECLAEEFLQGFEAKPVVENLKQQDDKEEKDDKDKAYVPGDYVIKSKEPGKGVQLAKEQRAKLPVQKQTLISVNLEKMDRLMNLMGEMVIAESVVLQNQDLNVQGLDLTNFKKAAGQLSKITTELQEIIMSLRMMPMTNVFQKMNRTVFDLSKKLDKDVELEMIGESTEVDKNIIEHISDPLLHMVRNAVDHGIEDKDERAAAGKNPKGKIVLEAKSESGKVYISVKDDGKGLDRRKIYKKAAKLNLVDGRREEDYTDREIFQFITYPGFSTNDKVTEVSGRGVGMDVVVQNIHQIGGRLDIESVDGKGSTMTMKIPLTLAIIEGVVMKLDDMVFVVETNSVKQFISVNEKMLVHEGTSEYVMIRGNCYPVLRLNERYHLSDTHKKVEDCIMLVLEHEGSYLCVLMDKLIGTQEIVVKPIPPYIRKINGISGCTQLGDGNIALILDVGGLMQE